MNKLTETQAAKLHSLIEKIRDRVFLDMSEGDAVPELLNDLDDAVAEVTEEPLPDGIRVFGDSKMVFRAMPSPADREAFLRAPKYNDWR